MRKPNYSIFVFIFYLFFPVASFADIKPSGTVSFDTPLSSSSDSTSITTNAGTTRITGSATLVDNGTDANLSCSSTDLYDHLGASIAMINNCLYKHITKSGTKTIVDPSNTTGNSSLVINGYDNATEIHQYGVKTFQKDLIKVYSLQSYILQKGYLL